MLSLNLTKKERILSTSRMSVRQTIHCCGIPDIGQVWGNASSETTELACTLAHTLSLSHTPTHVYLYIHTHTHIYIYIYIFFFPLDLCINILNSSVRR